MKSAGLALALAAGLAGAIAGYFALVAPNFAGKVTGEKSVARPVWAEAKWPFPIDQWGTGRAFACKAADCGTEVSSIFVPSSAPAIAQPVSRMTPTSIG
jgi:hypothetical protein